MTAQLDLALQAPIPEVTPSEVAELISRLRGRDWQTARDLGAAKESDKRRLRAIAEASEGQIISGQKGYKLTLESTPEEVAGGTRWLRNQGQKMIQRSVDIQRIYHAAAAGALCLLICSCAGPRYDSQGNGLRPGDKIERWAIRVVNQ